MSDQQHFDLLIMGSGEAGKNLAWMMAEAAHRTVVVERKLSEDCVRSSKSDKFQS